MMPFLRPLALALVLAVVAIGCGEEEEETQAPPKTSEGGSSGIEGVPLPGGAERVGDDQWEVADSSYKEVVAFYEEAMPEGEDWKRGWKWCDTGGGETIHSHIYAQGPREILGVTVVNDPAPGILIGVDKSGPC